MGQSAADMRTWMEVPLKGTQDLFVMAMNQSRDLGDQGPGGRRIWRPLIPECSIGRRRSERRYAIVLLPLVVNQKSVGLFYIDGDDSRRPAC